MSVDCTQKFYRIGDLWNLGPITEEQSAKEPPTDLLPSEPAACP